MVLREKGNRVKVTGKRDRDLAMVGAGGCEVGRTNITLLLYGKKKDLKIDSHLNYKQTRGLNKILKNIRQV